MPSVTPLPRACALSWKNDQGMVTLKQLILVDKSLPFQDVLSGTSTKNVYVLLKAICVSCLFDTTAVKGRGKSAQIPFSPNLQEFCPLFFSSMGV